MHVPARVIRPHFKGVAKTALPTRHGTLTTHIFKSETDPRDHDGPGPSGAPHVEHVALVAGNLEGRHGVLVRVHSECITSEVFGSLKCDCKEQLDWSLAEIARRGEGAVLYLRQEGRGIGLANKIRAYELQSRGLDTVDANRSLGLPDDARTYEAARDMLAHLGVVSVRLMTNNPDKIDKLRALGVHVVGRVPVVVPPTPFSVGYLNAKRERMAHDLPAYATATGTGDAE